LSSTASDSLLAAPTRATRPLTVQRQLHQLVILGGLTLFYISMIMPARLQVTMSVVTLSPPANAVAYGVGYPYFTILDAVMLAWGLAFWFLTGAFRRTHSSAVLVYVGVSLLSAVIAGYRYSVGLESDFFMDGVLGAVRLLAAYAVFASVPSSEARWARRLQNALAILFVVSLFLNHAGFQQAGTYSNEAGRLTASGFDFATTSYFGGVLVLSALTMAQGRRRWVLVCAGLVGLAMGGGRLALTIALPTIAFTVLRSRPVIRRTLIRIGLIGAALAVIAVVTLPSLLERIPTFRRSIDDAVYYVKPSELSVIAERYFPLLRSAGITHPAVLGRFNVWASALQLLDDRHWQPAGSDWRVQQGLELLGVPSHSHNGYLQTALKFGPLAFLVWVPLAGTTWRGLRRRSPYGLILLFLLLSLAFDYWMLVAKALFLLYAFAALNDRWLAEHPRQRLEHQPVGTGD